MLDHLLLFLTGITALILSEETHTLCNLLLWLSLYYYIKESYTQLPVRQDDLKLSLGRG